MKEAHLFNKRYCNKYEQEYIIVLFIAVEIFNITIYFSRKHNFWIYHYKLSQMQYSNFFFNAKQKHKSPKIQLLYQLLCSEEKCTPTVEWAPNTKNLFCWYFADIPSEQFFIE